MPSRGARPKTPRSALSGGGTTAASRGQGDVLLGDGTKVKWPAWAGSILSVRGRHAKAKARATELAALRSRGEGGWEAARELTRARNEVAYLERVIAKYGDDPKYARPTKEREAAARDVRRDRGGAY